MLGTLKANATVVTQDASGAAIRVKVAVKLKAPKARRRHHR
jgi:hypothetical protein